MHNLKLRIIIYLFLTICLLFSAGASLAAPANFEEAKNLLRSHVYHDQNQNGYLGTAYCGCDWQWVDQIPPRRRLSSAGRINHESCGYSVRSEGNRERSLRLEWEHVVPASSMGAQMLCWQNGGRRNCRTDPVFSAMEANMHNLTPSVGEVNADRSNYRLQALSVPRRHGACDFMVDFSQRAATPRDEVKGMFARIYFYIHDRYDLPMSSAQQRLFIAWNAMYPVTEWERLRDERIAQHMGHNNPFVTGERSWSYGHINSGEGVQSTTSNVAFRPANRDTSIGQQRIRGNTNSRIYHLPTGCPSYDKMSPQNLIEFSTEAEAEAAGFRKARNCR